MTLVIIVIMIGLIVLWWNLPTVEKVQPEPIIIEEKPVKLDDHIPLHGHGIIVGQTKSGKSNVLMSQIIRRHEAGHEIHIIDVKYEMAALFENIADVVEIEQATDKFQELFEITKQRQQLFRETGRKLKKPCLNAADYRKLTGNKMSTITLVVEELIVLMDTVDQKDLIKLLVIGRSAEVFVIAAAQYLNAKIINREGSINFTTRVFLGKYDKYAIPILFGNLEPDEVIEIQNHVGRPGMAALQIDNQLLTVRMPLVPSELLERYM